MNAVSKASVSENLEWYQHGSLHTIFLCAYHYDVKMCTCHCQPPVVLSEITIMKTKKQTSFTTQVRQRIRQLREQSGLTQEKLLLDETEADAWAFEGFFLD